MHGPHLSPASRHTMGDERRQSKNHLSPASRHRQGETKGDKAKSFQPSIQTCHGRQGETKRDKGRQIKIISAQHPNSPWRQRETKQSHLSPASRPWETRGDKERQSNIISAQHPDMPWDTRRDKWRRRETTQNHLPQHLTCVSPKRPAASRATFYSTSKQWRKCLRFRSKRAHSTCKTCDVLKSKMHHARDFWRHARACDEHLHHLSDTWKSRQCYWGGREREREREHIQQGIRCPSSATGLTGRSRCSPDGRMADNRKVASLRRSTAPI